MDHWRCRILGHSQEVRGGSGKRLCDEVAKISCQILCCNSPIQSKASRQGARGHQSQDYGENLPCFVMQTLGEKGWGDSIERRAGHGYVDIRLHHKTKCMDIERFIKIFVFFDRIIYSNFNPLSVEGGRSMLANTKLRCHCRLQ